MKNILAFLIFLQVHIFASSEASQTYKLGLVSYQNQDFAKTYKLFSSIYLEYLSNVEFNFMLGRSAYETGHYSLALAAFQRVEILDATNLRNRLEMARTYYMLRMYEDAQNYFEDVLSYPNLPKNIQTNIELALSKVSKVQDKSFTYSRIMTNLIYDSNVNYGSIDDYQYGGGIFTKIEERADFAAEIYANLTNIYDIGKKNGFAIKNSLSFYAKEYFQETDYSTSYLTYNPSLSYRETKFITSLILGVDILYLGKTKYLNTISIMPSIEYFHTPTLSSLAYFRYQSRDFFQESQDQLNSNRYEVSYGIQNILTPRSYIKSNLYVMNNTKISGSDLYVNFDEYRLNISYAKLFNTTYAIDLYAESRIRKYRDFSNGFNSNREDSGRLVNASFSYTIIPNLTANFKTSYEYVNSNQDRFSYTKYIISAGLIKTF